MQAQDPTDPTGVADLAPRPNTKRGPNTTAVYARNRKATAAVQMRLAGATWAEIAEVLGYPTPRTAMVATERALVKELRMTEDRAAMRRLAGARLDRLLRSAWSKAINETDPEHLYALTKAREVVADYRKLFGLDAPTEVIVHTPTVTELEAWVSAVLASNAPQVTEYDIIDGEVEEPHALPAG